MKGIGIKIKTGIAVLFMVLLGLSSCIREEQFDNTPEGNFEALWKMIDEKYCFFTYKGIDWDEIKAQYQPRISAGMSKQGLFEVLGDMLKELKDGHVNLATAYDVSRYSSWYDDYPRNFSENVQENYLGTDYRIGSGLKYKILEDNIGYAYYGSFSNGLGEGNMDEMFVHMAICDGIILDVRNNGGGLLTNSSKLASRFTNEKVLTGYITHKTGKGHDDFSSPTAIYLEPSENVRWQKKVVVLTNRHTYSAANDFISIMRILPNVTIVGDKTGGGSGMPFTSELPNGWTVRFSASPHYDSNMQHIEFGIDPDIHVDMDEEEEFNGIDTIIERARQVIKE